MKDLAQARQLFQEDRFGGDELVRLGPQIVTGTTSGAAHVLYDEDVEGVVSLEPFGAVHNSSGALRTVSFEITPQGGSATLVAELEAVAGKTSYWPPSTIVLNPGDALKVFADAPGVTVTLSAKRRL